jgi:hypothetical protein
MCEQHATLNEQIVRIKKTIQFLCFLTVMLSMVSPVAESY